jgi:hypothetical protein
LTEAGESIVMGGFVFDEINGLVGSGYRIGHAADGVNIF